MHLLKTAIGSDSGSYMSLLAMYLILFLSP